ncbi:hypothetical protein CANTEDRAFT_111925 [Yamadazyma tenuis ATCC 10573]|uniref:GRIP domain-containing protein n=2 Tax=Candida tenuis TaxID=2315449 RepID=G3BBY6_CANTC|nr:uncharacterized protein CANTEDRAFT_111925 [Yamadazyma tenuis ATCC 10573]EGV60116.1 hypothetical protein CANTEDRAFT_111925 [Yamadazyma tenuis ATCC 10573]
MEIKSLNSVIEELKETVDIKQADLDNLKSQLEFTNTKSTQLQAQIQQLQTAHDTQVQKLNTSISNLTEEKEVVQASLQESAARIVELETSLEKIKVLEKEVETRQILLGKARHEAVILNEHLGKALGMLKQQSNSVDNTIDKELISNVLINFLQIPRGDTKKYEALQLLSSLLEWDESKRVASGLSHHQQSGEPRGRESFISLWTDFLERESTKK